ncbi:hypothetical protein TNCV_3638471 [Trichonephila clavipes]|nr:hypothetical protein TNCV_3638471 [Trichonephila clavipes]
MKFDMFIPSPITFSLSRTGVTTDIPDTHKNPASADQRGDRGNKSLLKIASYRCFILLLSSYLKLKQALVISTIYRLLFKKIDSTESFRFSSFERATVVTNMYGTFPLLFLGVFLGIINSRIFPINSERRTRCAKQIGYLSRESVVSKQRGRLLIQQQQSPPLEDSIGLR